MSGTLQPRKGNSLIEGLAVCVRACVMSLSLTSMSSERKLVHCLYFNASLYMSMT